MNSPEPQVPSELTILYTQKDDGTWVAAIPELFACAQGPSPEQARAAVLHEAATDMMAYGRLCKEQSPVGTGPKPETIQLFLMTEGAACSSAVQAICDAAPALDEPLPDLIPDSQRERLAEARKQLQFARDRVAASVMDLGRLLGDEPAAQRAVESAETRDLIDVGRLGEMVELLPNLPQRPDPYGWEDVRAAITELAQGKPIDEARELRLRESYEAQVQRLRSELDEARRKLDEAMPTVEEREHLEIHCIDDGERHWYAAHSATAALRLAIRTGQIDSDALEVSTERVSEEKAARMTTDDDGTKRTLLEMFQRQVERKEPGLLSSTVY